MSQSEKRRNRLQRLLKKTGGDGLLVTNFTNVRYLTGFTGEDSYLLVTPTDAILISDFRFITQLEEECPNLSVEIRPLGGSMLEAIGKVVKKCKLGSLVIESTSMTVGLRDKIDKQLAKVELIGVEGLVEKLREIKDRSEVAIIRRAIRCAEKAFGVIRASLREVQTEAEIANQLDNQIRHFGGTGCSFPPIVAVGPRAALPHAVPTQQTVAEDNFILLDWGARVDGYISDLTRVLVTGRISPKLERIYEVVLKAERTGIAAIRPGATLHEVDRAARSVIEKAGYGKQFGHSLGHGIGLEVHEAPRLAARQNQPLQAGMVVTVEPGIYLPNWGGVRIEDDVLVTKDGHEVLSAVPKELADCVVN